MSEQRERFEAWAKRPPREWNIRISGPKEAWPGSYWSYPVQCAWEAWQAACPEEWQCVPKATTDGMVNAAFWAVGNEQRVDDLWTDLLSSAPRPEDV